MDDASQLSDDDLEWAVFHHVLHRIGEHFADPARRSEIVMELSDDLRAAFTTMLVEMEVANGGFHQYFWNPSGHYAAEALTGYERLGAGQHVAIMQEAMEMFGHEQSQQQSFKATGTLQGFADSARHSRLNDLNGRFYQANEDEDIIALRAEYIHRHPQTCELDKLEPCFRDLKQCPLNRRAGA
jgi:hypothetical protein